MNVVLFGASGMIGSRVLAELLQRGHAVTAVVHNPEKIAASGARVVKGDVMQSQSVAEVAKGADAAVSAYGPPYEDPRLLIAAARSLLAGLGQAGVKRVIMVGGAGSLEIAPGSAVGGCSRLSGGMEGHRGCTPRDVLPDTEGVGFRLELPSVLRPSSSPASAPAEFRLGGTKLADRRQGVEPYLCRRLCHSARG